MVRSAFLKGQFLVACCLMTLAACATSKIAPSPTPIPAPAAATTPPPSPSGAPDQATLDLYRKWIGEARVKHPYPESEARMYAVMMCESKGRAAAVNRSGPYTGLFQYGTPTWQGAWNTYREASILDPKSQIFATALAWSLKMQNQWGCYKKTG